MEIATFAAGCFWGVEDAFRNITGVIETRVGYTGGDKQDPEYIEVLTGKTGHAEAVEVTFDPAIVSYNDLLAVFWDVHDPTLTRTELIKDMWGIDDPLILENTPKYAGSHYRSSIFYHNEEQRIVALGSKEDMQNAAPGKTILTEIVPASRFYQAEDEHQQYFEKNADKRQKKVCNIKSCRVK
ncbi:peptide-methionine (S)-S-oxide reductase MsrA [Methanolobus sp. WCC5]|uniref:peptide-methionine (S)-S-oxide reductase MsrA n=1 Tax=Methanolobus sp. WCC5 TaxID=3125785 RepID=UPI003244391C